ncbi:ABC transporter permease [Methyloradius palustris]|uniref:ABC transporter permease n=1 Tax=Methyloradius palustris TaxID=2778876 RepID=A0A8D5G1F7_9PROT|nr:ABC transporter permease [Methyloradius palustris]BCM24338.1 ABC transporter permease [Methyloradius palustris]
MQHHKRHPWLARLSPIVLLLVWAWVAHIELISPRLLSSPLRVYQTFLELLSSGELQDNLLKTMYRLTLGFGIGAVSGLLFGIVMAVSRNAEDFFAPVFHAIRQIPTIALLPIFILIFGIDESFKIAIVVMLTFFSVALASYEATKGVSQNYFEVAQIYRLPTVTVYRKLILPAILLPTFTGLRIAFTRSWTILIASELLVADSGIGQMMQAGRDMFRLDIVLVGVVVTGLIGFAIDRIFKLGEKYLIPWRVAHN